MYWFKKQWIEIASSTLTTVVLLLVSITPAFSQSAPNGKVKATTRDESDKPVAGVLVEVKKDNAVVSSGTSDEKGEVNLAGVPAGTYEIAVSKTGFEPLSQPDVVVSETTPIEVVFVMVPKVEIKDTVNVKAASDQKIEQTASTPTELQRATVKDLPGKPATVTDTLPLVPGVVRSPQGEIKISGSGEHRSALIVNSADVTDPATGQFGVTVPVDSVESINVFKTPYRAQCGRFTAGVVSVETRRGGEKWDYELNDPLPEYRIRSGHLRGIQEASPRFVFNGPIIPGKLYF